MRAIQKGYADTAAGQVHYRRIEGPGPTIVLLHRTPTSSASFEPVLRQLAGCRAAVALDTPGFGQSFRPERPPSTVDYGRWLLAAIDALGIDAFHLVGHHTGTHLAAEIALLAPERARSLLLSGVIHVDAAKRAEMRGQIKPAAKIDRTGTHLGRTWEVMRSLYLDHDDALVHAETIGALSAGLAVDHAFSAIFAQDFPAVLAKVRAPVRIMQPMDDLLSFLLDEVHAARPDIPIELIGAAGLAGPERQPAAYARAIAALADATDPTPRASGAAMTDRRFELARAASGAGFDLVRTEAATPEPGPGEVLLRVHALSVNRRDVMIREGSYPVGPADHFVPLSDAAGEIVAVGEGVSSVKPGDRVASTFFQNWPEGRISLPAVLSSLGGGGPGVFADHVLLAERGVAPIPAGWSYAEAATIPCAAVTAWSALVTHGRLQRDDWVLVLGTGGVALVALQIATATGAKVVMLSSDDAKLERVRRMGAAATINYRETPDWADAVREATGGFGVQHAIELGGAGTLAKSVASLGVGGHVAKIGALAGPGGDLGGQAMMMAALRATSITVGSRADHVAVTEFLAEHDLRPVIAETFDADQAEAAYAATDGGVFGKVVIRMR